MHAVADIDVARDDLAGDPEAQIGLVAGAHHADEIAPRAVVPEGNTLHLDRPGGLCGRCCRLLTSRQRNQADKQRDRGQGS